MNQTNIRNRQVIHSDWLRALDFYKGEIDILRKRLTEIAARNNGDDVSRSIEQFENRFALHRDNIDYLEHDIRENAIAIGKDAAGHNGYTDTKLFETSDELKGRFITEEKLVNELRHAFNLFCIEWM